MVFPELETYITPITNGCRYIWYSLPFYFTYQDACGLWWKAGLWNSSEKALRHDLLKIQKKKEINLLRYECCYSYENVSFYIHYQIILLIIGLAVQWGIELIISLFSSSSRTIFITNTTSITLDLSSVSFLTSLLFVSPCTSLIVFLSIAFSFTDFAFGHITGIILNSNNAYS